ncbi:DUF2621 domain-containing protein [Metabacillus sp. GX 13764]|uniref:DUF2621 family protein n=1 Tax=Metabacillus kandeliae TaxID=2900151 RepID=UPI001E2C65F7|nr:DUF2621 family protein [Metabacillus kandeliae]MCD7033658.1 DUF2621 domain-containing protein [Metabacillus kandeliae]
MLGGMFLWFILLWILLMAGLLGIGGFFMFRKFLKRLPKEDGKSELDWQEHYIEKSSHLWQEREKTLLDFLVEPVPELFRDIARAKIAGKIGELALEEKASRVTEDHVIRGYILATPKRDHKFLRKRLKEKQIDETPYHALFQ